MTFKPRWSVGLPILLLMVLAGGPAASAQAATPTTVERGMPVLAAFSVSPAATTNAPGILLHREPLVDRALPPGSQAWRIQYSTTTLEGLPTTAMATVLAPETLPDDPMPVIAWNHGAVGLVQRCLPSAGLNPWADTPALSQAIARGWLVIATDYQVNAEGIHPFLIGEGEARSTLDAIRALHHMDNLTVANQAVVWGHSQGGHAALWTSLIAHAYAPDILIRGVVAISPATSLVSFLGRQRESSVAPLLGAWVATAYSAYYPDVVYNAIVTPSTQGAGRKLAARCPAVPLDGALIALLLGEIGNEPLLVLPAPNAFRARLADNEPNGNLAGPVVIAQGLSDAVVLPETTAAYVAARCATGATIAFWKLPEQDHLSLVQPGSPLETPLIAWTQERFAGTAPAPGCTEDVIGT